MPSLEGRLEETRLEAFLNPGHSSFWRLLPVSHRNYRQHLQEAPPETVQEEARTMQEAMDLPMYGIRDRSLFKIVEGACLVASCGMATVIFATVPNSEGMYSPVLAQIGSMATALGVYQVMYYAAEWISRRQQRTMINRELQTRRNADQD